MSWEVVTKDRATLLKSQLMREVGAGHTLHGRAHRVEALAADSASDDVLIAGEDHADEAFVVHLTWQASPSPTADWPDTRSLRISEIEKTLGVILRPDPISLPQARK